MLLYLSVAGITLSVILLCYNAKKNTSAIYLGVFFFLISLYVFFQYALLYSKSVFLISFLLAGFAVVFSPVYLIGPFLYWYVRSVLTDKPRLKKSDLWHLLPAIIYFVAALPYTFVPFSEKVEAARNAVENVGYIQVYQTTILCEIFSVTAVYLSRPALMLVYTLWSIGLFIRYYLRKKVFAVFSGQRFVYKWLILLLGFFFILVVTQLLLISRFFASDVPELFFNLNFFRILSASGLIGLLLTPLFFPAILYGLPRVPESAITKLDRDGKKNSLKTEAKKDTNHFENEYLNSINHKTDLYMEESKPYLQSDFNLAQLSVQIQIPEHHLGYYFREVKKQHFTDYRNEWRIEHAKKLINDGKVNELTLEAIASLSGFSNRNSFRITFQKIEGVSPSTFAGQRKK